ncbi:hypothetical protein ACQX0I_07855 [Corynebacterium diphtheriae]
MTSEEGKKQAIAANSTANAAQQTAIESLQKSSEANANASEANSNSIKALETTAKTDRALIAKNAEWNRLQDAMIDWVNKTQARVFSLNEGSKTYGGFTVSIEGTWISIHNGTSHPAEMNVNGIFMTGGGLFSSSKGKGFTSEQNIGAGRTWTSDVGGQIVTMTVSLYPQVPPPN